MKDHLVAQSGFGRSRCLLRLLSYLDEEICGVAQRLLQLAEHPPPLSLVRRLQVWPHDIQEVGKDAAWGAQQMISSYTEAAAKS